MAIVKLETGEELEFDNNYSDEQISQAVEEYLNQKQPKQTEQPKQSNSFLNVARGLPIGLGRAFVGGVQTAADFIAPDSEFSKNLAFNVQQQNQQLAQEPLSTRIGVGIGETLPFLTTGAGTGAKVAQALGGAKGAIAGLGAAGAIGGATQQGLSAQEEAGLENRAIEALKGGGTGAVFGAGLGTLGQGVKVVSKPFSSLVTRIKSELGNVNASKKIATEQLRQGLAKEGVDIAEALRQTSEEGKDLVDILDPRFATLNKGLRNLNRPETIKIADESLNRINQTTEKLQNEVLNLISNNKITPEQAGDILGRNSKKIFDKAIEMRRAKVEPLYKSALENGGVVNPKTTLESGEKLGDILSSPFIQKVIQDVRGKAAEFAKTPATKFYGDIYKKTAPIFEEKIVGRNSFTGQPIIEKTLKTGSKYKIPDNDIRVLYSVEKALGDMLANPQSITGMSVDTAAIKANKNAIAKFLDSSTPELTQARSQWAKLTRDIQGESKSLIGKYAKYYNEGRADELTKAAMNVLKMTPARISKAKQIDPQGFNDLLRSSIENRIASIQPLDDGVVNPKAFTKAFFSDEGKALEAATGDKEVVKGFRRLAENLDIRFHKNRIAKGAMESQARSVRVPTGKSSALNRVLEFAEDRLVSSPQAQKQFVEYLFSPEGSNALKAIANSEKNTQEQIVSNILKQTVMANLLNKSTAGNNESSATNE